MKISSDAGDARTAVTINPKGAAAHQASMPGLAEVWLWEHQLVEFGTRYTGSGGHTAYVDWLTHQLSRVPGFTVRTCLLYTSDAADEEDSVDLGGRRIIKTK